MKNKGFSLIELMVVIAIVAILAAVAYPNYKAYLVRSKMISVVQDLENYTELMIKYAQLKGKFPTAAELNAFPSTGIEANDPVSVNKYATLIHIYEVAACGREGGIRMDVSPTLIGLPEMNLIILASIVYHIDGMFKVDRTFMLTRTSPAEYVTGLVYQPGPGWINTRQDAAGSTAIWDATYAASHALSTCI